MPERSDPLVLGLPRGGVLVAVGVAAALAAPLDVLVVRKLGLPWQPELAMGAIAAVGDTVETVRVGTVLAAAGVDPETFEKVRQQELVRTPSPGGGLPRRPAAGGSRRADRDRRGRRTRHRRHHARRGSRRPAPGPASHHRRRSRRRAVGLHGARGRRRRARLPLHAPRVPGGRPGLRGLHRDLGRRGPCGPRAGRRARRPERRPGAPQAAPEGLLFRGSQRGPRLGNRRPCEPVHKLGRGFVEGREEAPTWGARPPDATDRRPCHRRPVSPGARVLTCLTSQPESAPCRHGT